MSDDRLADIKARRPHMCDSITREHIEWLIARVEELEAERLRNRPKIHIQQGDPDVRIVPVPIERPMMERPYE